MAYFSNGSEGEILERQCDDCPLGGEGKACPVLGVHLFYNYDQIGNDDLRNAMNVLVDDKGVCQVRKELKGGDAK